MLIRMMQLWIKGEGTTLFMATKPASMTAYFTLIKRTSCEKFQLNADSISKVFFFNFVVNVVPSL